MLTVCHVLLLRLMSRYWGHVKGSVKVSAEGFVAGDEDGLGAAVELALESTYETFFGENIEALLERLSPLAIQDSI